MLVSKVSNSISHGCDRGLPKAATTFPKRKYASVTTGAGGILSASSRTLLSSRYSTTLPKATRGRAAGRNRSCCCTGVTAESCIRTTLFICPNGQNPFCNVRLISRSENDSNPEGMSWGLATKNAICHCRRGHRLWYRDFAGQFSSCTPQIRHPISRSNFFEPIFMVQPAKDILDSHPATGWQLMPLNSRPTYWFPLEIRESSRAPVVQSLAH